MVEKVRLRVAIQKNGRLNNESLDLLLRCGLRIKSSKNELLFQGENLNIDLILMRDDDIPVLVADDVCDIGIVGLNVLRERELELKSDFHPTSKRFDILKYLGFGGCRLSLAVPNNCDFSDISALQQKKIATSYPFLLKNFLEDNKVCAEIIHLSGSVEIAPRLKLAELICDLVATGETLQANNLKEVRTILTSEAVLFKAEPLLPEKEHIVKMLLTRINAVLEAKESKYIMFHLPKQKISCLKSILPGIETPSILPLNHEKSKVAVHVVSKEKVFWETLENLKAIGASSILVLPIEKMLR